MIGDGLAISENSIFICKYKFNKIQAIDAMFSLTFFGPRLECIRNLDVLYQKMYANHACSLLLIRRKMVAVMISPYSPKFSNLVIKTVCSF